MRPVLIALLAAGCGLSVAPLGATAQSRGSGAEAGGGHPASAYYRKAPQVRGFVQRRGGYSYSAADVINTYSNNRAVYGSTNTYRNPYLDLQTRSGPFDHGFFFDSGVLPRGGNSPYPN